MTDEPASHPAPQHTQLRGSPELEPFVRALGKIFSNIALYGIDHKITDASLVSAYEHLVKVLEHADSIAFSNADGHMLINGHLPEFHGPFLQTLEGVFSHFDISGLILQHGMSMGDFVKLAAILSAKLEETEKKDFGDLITQYDIAHVEVRKAVYRQIEEDEVVVTKEDEQARAEQEQEAAKQALLAYIRGESAELDLEQLLQDLPALLEDGNTLGELIMQAAESAGDGDDAIGRINRITAYFKKTFGLLVQSPAGETVKGRKQLKKVLLLMQKFFLQKLVDLAPGNAEDLISETVDELKDQLDIESLAAEYMKKREAIDELENRIQRFMKKMGDQKLEQSALEQRLADGGMNRDGWRELVGKSGIESTDTTADQADGTAQTPDLIRLEAMLSRLEQRLGQTAQGAEMNNAEFQDNIENVDTQVGHSAATTAQKIGRFTADAHASLLDQAAAAKTPEEKARIAEQRQNYKVLAEIVQEFRQPLSVIISTADMLSKKLLGDVSDKQLEMLRLTSGSGDRLASLVDKLAEISGMPDDEHPDTQILEDLYK